MSAGRPHGADKWHADDENQRRKETVQTLREMRLWALSGLGAAIGLTAALVLLWHVMKL